MTLEPGKRLGRYQILAPIGAGGMGEVYSATDTRLKRTVAVKVLPADVADDPARLARFAAEAQAAARLNHPNILAIHDAGSEDGIEYIVTELLEGQSLRQRLNRSSVSRTEAIQVAIAVAQGLAAAHARSLVHRDIKPENIFVTSDGRVKILDFGLARSVAAAIGSDSSTQVLLTEPGTTLGTLGYASPEQLSGEDVDGRSDLFSLGVVLYESLTGQHPFRKQTAVSTIQAVLTEEPAELARLVADAPPLATIVRRCLAKKREERFQSAGDLAFALESLNPGASRQDSAPSHPRGVHRPAWIGALSVVCLALLLAGFVFTRMRSSAARPPTRALAVLPFHPLVPNKTEDYLGLGLADAVISKLSSVSALTVRPTSAVRRFLGSDVDSLMAGKELNVDSVLDGTFQRAGDRLRVTVNLVRMSDGAAIWSQTLDTRSNDVFALQDEISKTVADKLEIELNPGEQHALQKQYTSNTAAYDAFLRGSFAFDRRVSGGRATILEAMGWYQKAVELDPNYALALAQLAYCHVEMGIYLEPQQHWIDSARPLLARAEQLDPSLAVIHVVRSEVLYSAWENFDTEGALREARLAQELDRNAGHLQAAHILFHLGLMDEALRELELPRRADPFSEFIKLEVVASHFYGGDFVNADRLQRDLLGRPEPEQVLKLAFLPGSDRTARLEEVRQYFVDHPGETSHFSRAAHALLLAVTGQSEQARREIEEEARRTANTSIYHHMAHDAACVYATTGDSRRSVEWLQRMIDSGMPDYPLIVSDPHLSSLHNDPGYIALTAKLKSRFEEARARYH